MNFLLFIMKIFYWRYLYTFTTSMYLSFVLLSQIEPNKQQQNDNKLFDVVIKLRSMGT